MKFDLDENLDLLKRKQNKNDEIGPKESVVKKVTKNQVMNAVKEVKLTASNKSGGLVSVFTHVLEPAIYRPLVELPITTRHLEISLSKF